MDSRPAELLGVRVTFTRHGFDEGTEHTGRGPARILGGELQGHLCFHLGDDSAFRAVRQPTSSTRQHQTMKEEAGQGSATGLIAGGVRDALLGRQVGGGSGKDLVTIAGAVGGAYAGKKIKERMTVRTVWTATVRYPNGTRSNFAFDRDPGFAVGDPVKNAGASITRQ